MKYDEICKVEETTNQLSVFPLHLEFWCIRPISTNIRRFQGPSLPAAGTPQHASPTSCRPLNVHDLLKMNICRRQECKRLRNQTEDKNTLSPWFGVSTDSSWFYTLEQDKSLETS